MKLPTTISHELKQAEGNLVQGMRLAHGRTNLQNTLTVIAADVQPGSSAGQVVGQVLKSSTLVAFGTFTGLTARAMGLSLRDDK